MKIKLSFSIFLFLLAVAVFSQDNVGIGTTSPDPSAILDLNSTNKGLLPPRMTVIQRNAIASPATGLIIFNTTDSQYEYNAGTPSVPNWVVMSADISIELNMPTQFAIAGSPANGNGTFDVSWENQNQNLILASPNGVSGTPAFRTLDSNDIPNLNASKITSGTFGVAQGGTGVATITGMLKGNGTDPITGVSATAGELTYWASNDSIAGLDKLTYDATNAILEFDGSIKFTPQASAPTTPSAGMTYYDDTANKLYLYDGSAWLDLTATGGGGGGDIPSGAATYTLRYSDANTVVATSALRVDNSNVGIGEIFTPSALVHTDAGNATASYHKFTAGTTTNRGASDGFDIGIDADGKGIIKNYENQPITFATNNVTRMNINGGYGGVQILTNSGSGLVNALNLHNPAPASVAMSITNGKTGNATTDGLRFEIDADGDFATINQKENKPLLISTNNTERMRIWENGQIGINTSATLNDSIQVEIVGDLRIDGDLIVTGNIDPISIIFDPQDGAPNDSPEGTIYYDANDKKLNVYNGSDWSPIVTGSASGGSSRLSVETVNSNYSVESYDDVIICNGTNNFTLTLPSATGLEGKVFYFILDNTADINININPSGSETIDGGNNCLLHIDRCKVTIVSDNSNWYVISSGY